MSSGRCGLPSQDDLSSSLQFGACVWKGVHVPFFPRFGLMSLAIVVHKKQPIFKVKGVET